MLASLKYYWDIWPRARTFALMTSFLKPMIQDVHISKGLPHLAIPTVDIYLQEFYLHSFSKLYQHRESFTDSKDGFTFMKLQFEDTATSVLMTWFGEQENRKWFHKIRRNMKKYKAQATDDFETEYIDVDVLLDLYIDEYSTKRKANLKELQKEFMKQYANRKDGTFATDEVEKIV